MLELLMAMVMLNVGVLAIVAAFSSGNAALARASQVSTAAALADKQMELYRGADYDNILFTTSEWNAALADSVYTSDTVYQQNMLNPQSPKALVATVTSCPTSLPTTTACDPSFVTTGADHRSYRVDTYLYYDTPSYGNQLKTVTVVVRSAATNRNLTRVTSTFDSSIG